VARRVALRPLKYHITSLDATDPTISIGRHPVAGKVLADIERYLDAVQKFAGF
jgi:hypothetical protein